MNQGWLYLLIASSLLLIIVLVRVRIDFRWFGYVLLNLVVAAVVLFLINGTGWLGEFPIPHNVYTLFTIAILGFPGLLLLIAVKATLI